MRRELGQRSTTCQHADKESLKSTRATVSRRAGTVTFTQLRTFALVAELGSVRAAAAALGVSEPAVSAAVAALRADLRDPLFVRSGGGIALTPGGRALAGRARELVRLADRTRREVAGATAAAPGWLRVLAAPSCAEHVAPLLRRFADRTPGCEVDLSPDTLPAGVALAEDLADAVLGHRPAPLPGQHLSAVPFLRYRRVMVAAPGHPLAGRPGPLPGAALAGSTWATGPGGLEPGSEEERWAGAQRIAAETVPMGSEGAALEAARQGRALVLALTHTVPTDLRDGRLVRLPVDGTPVTGLWWVTVAGPGRAPAAARNLQRFLTTPDATAALLDRSPRPDRLRPRVRVELWS
jgi:LysR family transcriptional regulator, low CO2-responsive transcriptional regulator